MSIQSIQSQIVSTQREIQSLQSRLSDKTRQEADKTSRIASINRSVSSSTSLLSIQSKQREVQGLENGIAQLQRDKADVTHQIADKTVKLHGYQQDLFKEQEREQKKFQDNLTRSRQADEKRQSEALQKLLRASIPAPTQMRVAPSSSNDMEYDAFISHASEDKEDVARPLAEALQAQGHKVWYDEFNLKVGDSLRRSIDKGLAKSKFGIVILSPAFFAKNWPQYELDGLVAKEMSGGKVILPIWHKVSKDEVMQYSPSLADKMALSTSAFTIEELSKQLSEAIED